MKNNAKKQNKEIISVNKPKLNQYDKAARTLVFYMLKDEKIINMVEKKITFFQDPNIRALSNEIISYYHKYNSLNIADFISYICSKEEEIKLFNEIMTLKLKDTYVEEEIEDYIKVINSYPLKNKVNELSKKIKDEKDPIKQASILSEILSLKGVKQ